MVSAGQQEEEAMFANMWYQDIEAKKEREDQEAKRQHERNQQTLAVLKEQMKVLEDQRLEQKRLRNETARLMVSGHLIQIT